MKNSSFLLIAVLVLLGTFASSCGGVKGCKGGGWYGDRNLTLQTPSEYNTPSQQSDIYVSECTD